MDYLIVITTVLSILICLSNADKECGKGKVCMDLHEDREEKCIQDFYKASDHSNIKRCNEDHGICSIYEQRTVSQQSEFLTLTYITICTYMNTTIFQNAWTGKI